MVFDDHYCFLECDGAKAHATGGTQCRQKRRELHGFDTDGAKFDQFGNLGSLWANENDSQEFQKRVQ